MKTRLANGLILTVFFTMNSAWACQFAPAPPGNDDRQLSIGGYVYTPLMSEQKQPTVEGTLEHDPAFKEAARKAWEEVSYGDLPQEAGFMVSRDGTMSPVQLGKEIGSNGSQVHAQGVIKSTPSPVIPFELVSGFLVVVDGQIGNLDGLKFILDTGATHSLIDRKVADRLHLKRRSGEVISFDRSIPVEWAIIPELRVGPLRTETLRVMVVKLAEYSELAEHADGIIGLDLLSQSKKFTIDYDTRTVSLQLAEVGTTGRSSYLCFVIPLVVQGLQVNLAVDTGLQSIVLYKNRLRKGLPKMRIEGESTNVVMGRLRGTQVRLPGVRIGHAEVVSTAILIDGPDDKTLPGVDGYLGPATLQAKRIEFDFDAKVLRWQ